MYRTFDAFLRVRGIKKVLKIKKVKSFAILRKVSGLPAPEIEWKINGKPVIQDSLHKIVVRENNVHSLLLERVSPMDEGQYTITASNKAGSTTTHIQLKVSRKTSSIYCFYVNDKTMAVNLYKYFFTKNSEKKKKMCFLLITS